MSEKISRVEKAVETQPPILRAVPSPTASIDTQSESAPPAAAPAAEPTSSAPIPAQLGKVTTNLEDGFDDLASQRFDKSFTAGADVVKVLTRVTVGRPRVGEFIRVHPDPSYQMEAGLVTLEKERTRTTYFLHPSLHLSAGKLLKRTRLYTYVTTQGAVGLWPINVSEQENSWLDSNHDAAKRAMSCWLRVESNMAAQSYEIYQARGTLSEPQWPTLSFNELLNLAFKDKYIKDPNHIIMQRIRGEVD
jgi:hypothetical protein